MTQPMYVYYSNLDVFENEEHHFIKFDDNGNEIWNEENPAVIIEKHELILYGVMILHPEVFWNRVELKNHWRIKNKKLFVKI
jgi:hypothetical protein